MTKIRFVILFIFCSLIFTEDDFSTWIQENSFSDSVSFIDLKCIVETKMKINDFENSSTKQIHLKMDRTEQFSLEMDGVIIVSDNVKWERYDSRTNQLFIQSPDSSFLNIVKMWKQYFTSNDFQPKKDKDVYIIHNIDMLQKITIKFDSLKNQIESINISSPDSEIKVNEIYVSSKSVIPANFNIIDIENAFIFDLRE